MAKKTPSGTPAGVQASRPVPPKHPRPDLPQATWSSIHAAIATAPSSGFVAAAKACRAARRDGKIPSCSNQQLDAALKFLANTGELVPGAPIHLDDNTPEPSPASPAIDPLHIHINRFLAVIFDKEEDQARVVVAGKPFLHCSFIVASIPADTEEIRSIDDLAAIRGARVLETPHDYEIEDEDTENLTRIYLTPAEEVLAHASNLQAWTENDYDTHLLHSNIAFPLLKELAAAGDDKARRVLAAAIAERVRDGSEATHLAIIESCSDFLSESDATILARSSSAKVRSAIAGHPLLPVPVLRQLSQDERYEVRMQVAYNPNLPVELLEKLASDEVIDVRRTVASRNHLDPDLTTKLLHDKESIVRFGVTERLDIPHADATPLLEALVDQNQNALIDLIGENHDNWIISCAKLEKSDTGFINVRLHITANRGSENRSATLNFVAIAFGDSQTEFILILDNLVQEAPIILGYHLKSLFYYPNRIKHSWKQLRDLLLQKMLG